MPDEGWAFADLQDKSSVGKYEHCSIYRIMFAVRRRGTLYLQLSFLLIQLRAYEQGMCARLNQTDDDLRALRCERHDALRDLNASKDQTQVWVVWWKRIAIF